MADLSALKVNGVLNLELAVFIGNDTLIALLAAHGAIESGFICDNGSGLAVCKRLYKLLLCSQNGNLRIHAQLVIAYEFRGNSRIDGLVYGHVCTHVVGCLAGLAGLVLLLLHGSIKAFLINAAALFLQDLSCQIQREAVGVVKLKCIFSG